MIGGDAVDGAVDDAGNQRLTVLGRTQRGIQLEAALFLEHAVIHHKVMGAGFAGHIHAPCLCLADDFHAFLGRNVANMVFAANLFYQF